MVITLSKPNVISKFFYLWKEEYFVNKIPCNLGHRTQSMPRVLEFSTW